MQNAPLGRLAVLAGVVAAVFFIGNIASNLIATDLQPFIQPYRLWVWIVGGVALVVAIGSAIAQVRRNERPPVAAVPDSRIVNASDKRSIAIGGNVENSTLVTGNKNVVDNKVDGDLVVRDKIIIQQTATPAVNALHQLRPPVGDFVGREPEIETLLSAIRNGSSPSITGINGMGGTGKTELALLVAQRLLGEYPEAQFFINLQGTDAIPRPPQDVMANCIRAFRGPEVKLPEDLNQLSQLYLSELNNKRVLLLLDNAADSAQVRPLVPPPGCALLVTSRQAIALPAMTSLTLTPLTEQEARELLLEIAPRAERAADQICKLCGYLPLAIRATGSLLATTADLDPLDYATQLNDERNRLERIGTEGVELGVTASFNLSYERLTPEAASVFRFLSVFPGTFTAVAAEEVCADEDHAHLSDLLRRRLVLYDESTKRYRLHDLARLFAAAKLSAEERFAGQKRYATHYTVVLRTADELYQKGVAAQVRGLALFDLEWANIQAGQAWVAAQGIEVDKDVARLAMVYAAVGVFILSLRQKARDRISWLEIALAAAQRLGHRSGESAALGNLGLAYTELGEPERSIEFYEQQLPIAREVGDRLAEGSALGNLGLAYAELGQPERAIPFYEQQLTIARNIRDQRGEGTVLGSLGNAYMVLNEIDRAIQFYEQQLTVVREIGDRRGESNALGNVGVAHHYRGESERAIEFYEQQLAIVREIGYRRGEGAGLWNMSLALNRLGQRAQAIQYAEQALTIFEQIENPNAAAVRARLAEWRT